MKKTLKMSLLGMASVATLAAPVALAVSCGSSDDNGVLPVAAFKDRDAVGQSEKVANGTTYKMQLVLDGDDHSKNDNSFNQAAYKAITDLNTAGGVHNADSSVIINAELQETKPAAPSAKADFVTAYTGTLPNTIMLMPGFMHIDPLIDYLKTPDAANKGKYAILLDGDVANPRVASVNFQAHQGAFEAGVLAGYYLNANKDRFFKDNQLKVATFGGLNIPTVTGSMAGFQKGIEYFNEHNDATMTDVIFMDNGSKADYFSGGFAPNMAKPIADKLVTGGADLIFPVAGPQAVDVMNSIITNKSSAQIIGVDTAQETDSTFNVGTTGKSYVAFSALKNLTKAATDIMNVIAGNHVDGVNGLGHQTIGTLENGLVGVSQGSATDEIYALATADEVKAAAIAMKLEFNY